MHFSAEIRRRIALPSDHSMLAAELLETGIRARLRRHHSKRPLLVGICGSQGSGKSTACAHIARSMATSGTRIGVLSLDDLYLPRHAREVLARRIHPLLRTRGVPGTHEPLLGLRTFQALASSEMPSRADMVLRLDEHRRVLF
jgi:D-glycerate 3-kinase